MLDHKNGVKENGGFSSSLHTSFPTMVYLFPVDKNQETEKSSIWYTPVNLQVLFAALCVGHKQTRSALICIRRWRSWYYFKTVRSPSFVFDNREQVTPRERSSAENQEENRQGQEEQEEQEEEEEEEEEDPVAPRSGKRRRLCVVEEDEDKDEDEGEEEEERMMHSRRTKLNGDGTQPNRDCPICAMDIAVNSAPGSDKCVVRAHHRPATALSIGSPKRTRQEEDQSAPNQGSDNGGGRGGFTSGAGGRRGGEATRQRRRVARVNYAEDSDDDGDGRGRRVRRGRGPKTTARGQGRRRRTSGNAPPRTLVYELRLEAVGDEEALPDEVREFRRRVRSAVKCLHGKDFALHFRDAVDLELYRQYPEKVTEPMDLAKIMVKLRQGEYDSREVSGEGSEVRGRVCATTATSARFYQ